MMGVIKGTTSICFLTTIMVALFFYGNLGAAEKEPPETQETYVFYTALESPVEEILAARIREAFRRLNRKAELVVEPSSERALILANQDGDGDAARLKDLKLIAPQHATNLLLVPESLIDMEMRVYSKDLDFPVEGWACLGGYHNGARVGAKILEKNIPGERTFLPTTAQIVQMLAADRIDTMVEWNLIAEKTIRDLGVPGIRKLSPPLLEQSLYLYLHKRHQSLVPQVAVTLGQMKEDGTFEQIAREILTPAEEQAEYLFYSGAPSPVREIVGARLKEAFKRIGKEFKLIDTGSAERALLNANADGDGDAIRVANIKEIAPELTVNLVQIPEVIMNSDCRVYTKEKVFAVNGWKSLKEYRNGFRVGVKILEKNIPGQITMLPDSERLFHMLDQLRLDTVVEHEFTADQIIRKSHLTGIRKLEPPLISIPQYSYIHKKHQALIPGLVKALSEMKADGFFQQIKTDVLSKAATSQ